MQSDSQHVLFLLWQVTKKHIFKIDANVRFKRCEKEKKMKAYQKAKGEFLFCVFFYL